MIYIAIQNRNMITIENEVLKVSINPRGAELTSVVNKATGLEYMWQADPAVWPKHSPVLFPIVGMLKNGEYKYKGKNYELPRHGFSREKMFQVTSAGKDEAVFTLVDDEETRAVYPFQFRFRLKYSLFDNTVSVTYEVLNLSEGDMFFSVGGHPAFRVPLTDDTDYNDYLLEFDAVENEPRWPVSKDGLIETSSQPMLSNSRVLSLTRELFN
ncbi:MAG: aldose 1-epimerase family protein, partial [Chitinophagaceae bacterium]